jgi:hypothetical protein
VDNIILIWPTPKKSIGEEIPWKTINKIKEKKDMGVGVTIRRKIRVIWLTDE